MNERKNKENRRLKRRGDRARSNKSKLRQVRFKSRTRQGEKAYKGDITGRKVTRIKSSRLRSNANYAQPNPYAGRKRKTEASVAKKALSKARFTQRPSENAKKASGPPRTSTRPREKAWKGGVNGRALNKRTKRVTFTGKSNYQGGSVRSATRSSEQKATSGRVVPRSASGAYRVRKRKTPYSSFRPKKKWEKAFKGDITGRTFQTKRTTGRPGVQKPPKTKYTSPGRKGDQAYSGGFGGGYKSATRRPERAWKKDISGNKLRIRTSEGPKFDGPQFTPYPKNKSRRGDRAYKGKIKGGSYKSVSSRKERAGKKLSGSNPPGSGTSKGLSFQGNIKAGKPLKGGGSISGKRWNNSGKSITKANNAEQNQRARSFQGNIKAGKPLKGGGSISGIRWNNKGQSITKQNNSEQSQRVRSFQGNIKAGKPLKGGGSISGIRWNNKGQSITKQNNSEQSQRVRSFQGNLKQSKYKGGYYDALSSTYKGGEKRRFDYKRHPSADKKAIKVRFSKNKDDLAGYQGTLKQRKYKGGNFDALAGTYKGNQKRKFDYKKNPNAAKESLKVKEEQKNDRLAGNYQGTIKDSRKYKKNPAAADEALKKHAPNKNYFLGGNFTGRTKQTWKYKQNPNAADESLKNRPPQSGAQKGADFGGRTKVTWSVRKNPSTAKESLLGIAPSKETARGTAFKGRTKLAYNYKRNPNSVSEALKGRGPSKAAISASNYQGNIKMSKKSLQDRHPSLKYARGKNSATQEKEKLFSLKLLFAKIFKKNEGQPDNVKEKERAPRFDKREREIWYD
ncbi:hypothetical protein [Fulvivirga lutea]|uniref:Uncharacterized protein n=1 Tax=Fulvivirga lutea TaxID=2810512 RepID=A0A974WIS0_9BACT|nr:hypothetical protein [Fulvivirga lutea]QSE97892.1 hypothetical protein JR347_02055 [Fulvivirga lutea]